MATETKEVKEWTVLKNIKIGSKKAKNGKGSVPKYDWKKGQKVTGLSEKQVENYKSHKIIE